MHTHIHTHAYAHVCTDTKSQQQRLNVSSNIIDAHTHPYAYACIYTHIYVYTYVHNLQRVCSQMCTLVQKHTCVTYTPAHAIVPKTPVKCMKHSLQKNAHTHIGTNHARTKDSSTDHVRVNLWLTLYKFTFSGRNLIILRLCHPAWTCVELGGTIWRFTVSRRSLLWCC